MTISSRLVHNNFLIADSVFRRVEIQIDPTDVKCYIARIMKSNAIEILSRLELKCSEIDINSSWRTFFFYYIDTDIADSRLSRSHE